MSKKDYRVRNWKDYNKALVNRGSITLWFSEDFLSRWHNTEQTGKRGRPIKYSDEVIECGLTVKGVYKLPFRATQGFMRSVVEMLKVEVETPHYSLLCKRQKSVCIKLKNNETSGKKLDIVVDTTGLKVYGEGEWKVRQHGYVKHRLWRKLHLAVNEASQEIEAMELTDLGAQDCEGLPLLVAQIGKEMMRLSKPVKWDEQNGKSSPTTIAVVWQKQQCFGLKHC